VAHGPDAGAGGRGARLCPPPCWAEAKKERLGTAESRRGRSASQVAANLGVAAIVSSAYVQSWFIDSPLVRANQPLSPMLLFSPVGLAALAEAAADTASSEVGQVFGGRPRMITTLRQVEPGRDGAISLAGTLAGSGRQAMSPQLEPWRSEAAAMFAISCAGGVFGLLFDSLLGATLEERGWLNNDAVNFLSTISAAGFAVGLLVLFPRFLGG
jgi:uncharacterized protein (TIGR00297 family)